MQILNQIQAIRSFCLTSIRVRSWIVSGFKLAWRNEIVSHPPGKICSTPTADPIWLRTGVYERRSWRKCQELKEYHDQHRFENWARLVPPTLIQDHMRWSPMELGERTHPVHSFPAQASDDFAESLSADHIHNPSGQQKCDRLSRTSKHQRITASVLSSPVIFWLSPCKKKPMKSYL